MLLDLEELDIKYQMNVSGVLHIGAHYGEENYVYQKLNYSNKIFFEPLSKNFSVLCTKVRDAALFNLALGSREGRDIMYVESANQGQSSSILKPKLHLQQYPHITFPSREQIKLTTLDKIMEKIDGTAYNFINMDVQGYELEVLKGAVHTLDRIDYLMCEVNRAEVYENCCMVEEIDEFLKPYNLHRVETTWDGGTWGDAFYVRSEV